MVKVLFVCFGNVCRSPMAQGIFTRLLEREGLVGQVEIQSAGTHAYHLNASPDPRACRVMARHGIDIRHIKSRRLVPEDFEHFDYLIAMDEQNYRFLAENCPAGYEVRLKRFMEYAPDFHATEVPDPYYGPEWWFDRVIDMLEAAAEGLIADLRRKHFSKD